MTGSGDNERGLNQGAGLEAGDAYIILSVSYVNSFYSNPHHSGSDLLEDITPKKEMLPVDTAMMSLNWKLKLPSGHFRFTTLSEQVIREGLCQQK